jgi:molybdopterin/thiamine biosynthesis adenylyltransferase/rhodanese-related sulfurtransferase
MTSVDPKLNASELRRYGRQMILSNVGRSGQERLKAARLLLVGAGGIGSSAAMYLAASGIFLTIMDHDMVDLSNLHRQVIHDSGSEGINKATSAVNRLQALNPLVTCTALAEKLTCDNALSIISTHDLVIDATDNIEVRYIINDACVLLKRPFISGSAIGLEGQIMVIIPDETPCYRCIYPSTSLGESCRSCANIGVLGPVPGLVGCLEAMEAIKFLLNDIESSPRGYQSSSKLHSIAGSQLLYDGYTGDFMRFQLPERFVNCAVCGSHPTITSLQDTQYFIEQCQTTAKQAIDEYTGTIADSLQITCAAFAARYHSANSSSSTPSLSSTSHMIILDVRSAVHYDILTLNLPGLIKLSSLTKAIEFLQSLGKEEVSNGLKLLINLPLAQLPDQLADVGEFVSSIKARHADNKMELTLYTLCRRGVDSTVATRLLTEHNILQGSVFNIQGGLLAWHYEVDTHFPFY